MAMENKLGENDYSARLDNSMCRYEGEAVFVRVMSRKQLNLYKPSDIHAEKPFKAIDPRDPKFDIESVPLGYLSYQNKVFYITRGAYRRFVQGVTEKSITIDPIPGSGISLQKGINARNLLYTSAFEDMVADRYPAFDRLFEHITRADGFCEVALSRNVALAKNPLGVVNVYFKNDLVGWMAPGSRVVHVPDNEMGWVVSQYIRDLNWTVE